MARDRKAFEEAMRTATNVAWEGNWDEAIEAYQRALAEFPDDVDALTGLGMACSSAGRLEDALDAYQKASKTALDDPVLWERIGKTHEQLDRMESAAEAYLTAAEHYLEQEASHTALERWQDAVRVWPDCVPAHVELLKYYQRHGRARDAAEESLTLARIYQDQGRVEYAIQACQHALKLVPHNSEALSLRDSLRYGEHAPAKRRAEEKAEASGESELGILEDVGEPSGPAASGLRASPETEVAEERGSPVESARRRALTDLAESVFEEEEVVAPAVAPRLSKEEIDALIGRAIDFQTRGKIEKAIAAYEEVNEAGVRRPAVHFNLGLLYQEKLRFDEAIDQFEHAISDAEYRLGSHFALGECYRARGRIDEALEHFIEVLKIVDLVTVQRKQADDLIQLYENLVDVYVAKGYREQAFKFMNSLVTFLSEQGWEDKVKQARQRLDQLTQEGPAMSLAEVLAVPGAEAILESVALSQEYAKRGMFYTALEECYFALQTAPDYLPIHRQLAEVFLEMRKSDEAVAKFATIADAYKVQGRFRQAMAMYERALKLAPMDTTVRAKLIDLLVSHGEIDLAVEQHLILADSYYHMAQMDQAREVYEEALRLAPRGDKERDWTVRILHKIGDIDMQRVDWRRAIGVYERIREIAPDDERSCLTLMGLYYRLDQPRRALMELDELLEIYRERGRSERIFTILNDVVDRWPDVIPLRARLAQAYLDAGEAEEALVHLDELGDLQLEAGREADARATIEAIIALRPPNVEEYQALLDQL